MLRDLNRTLFALLVCFTLAYGQSTATVQGTVTDASGAPVPNAKVLVRNESTGEERSMVTDSSGTYVAPSLPVGSYRLEVSAPGMQTTVATGLALPVGTTVRRDFALAIAGATETVEVRAGAPVVESTSVAAGGVISQVTVQEIPLNGRHFVDLALLVPGTVTPPQNGFLTAPLRGQGSFAFNSAGQREDSINFMVNGINLSDPSQNQITFQPTINTIQEFKIDNSTYSAEYGRNSGSIVNIATRSGTNQWHGEVFEFIRNNDLDARNFTNPKGILMAPFKRNQFGADGGGDLVHDKTFLFLSYEGLRQRQAVPLSTPVLSDAQRAQGLASSDPIIQKLIPLIPQANSTGNLFVSSAIAPVDIDQGTANFAHNFTTNNRFNFYYAFQRDNRSEPPTTQGNNLPGFGDTRAGHRQILTLNDTFVISPYLVNEGRLGFNRIKITFQAANALDPTAFGISSGVSGPLGLPQMSVTGAFTFGGINGFPQGRGDNTVSLSDSVTWTHGNHSIKFGGEVRRANSDNFASTPGTFTFPNVTAFLNDQASAFSGNPSNRSNRTYVTSVGGFVSDTWKISPALTASLGVRYDWYGTPTEAQNRFVVFDSTSDSLLPVNRSGGPGVAYQQSSKNFQPRVGFAWNPFRNDKTIIRSAFAIMTDQPILGLVTGLAANPPYALPVSFSPTAANPFVSMSNAFALSAGSIAPVSVAHGYKDAYVSEWNFNVQQDAGHGLGLMAGYFASKGTHLNLDRNYNQLVNGVRPYAALSASSPIDPGKPLSNILVYESIGNSSYNGLWLTAKKEFSAGLQFNASYTFSKSIDYNSRNVQGLVVQDSYNVRNDRGLSDFDARNRIVLSAIYMAPWRGNRLKEGWEFSLIEQSQSGNPINFHITAATLTGVANQLRPDVTGPVLTGYSPALNGAATNVSYIQNPGVFVNQGGTHFGNLGRNVVIGPGFSNLDFSVVKNTRITERIKWQVRADAFDLLNQENFGQPGATVGTATFGLITNTRFAPGDSGSSRQLQLAMKLLF